MPLPEKEYFTLEEIERRWGIERADTVYYAENGLLAIAVRVVGVVLETGVIEAEPDGRWFKIPEELNSFSDLLTLCERDLSAVFRSGGTPVQMFRAEANRYVDVIKPEGGVHVRVDDLVVTRAERDRFERAHGLTGEGVPAWAGAKPPAEGVACRDDGGWIKVHGREYLFAGLVQKTAIRRLYEAWASGTPRLNMQALLEDIESGSRHIAQVFSGADPRWREIVGYGRPGAHLAQGR